MKFIVLALALFGAVAFAAAEEESEFLADDYNPARFRRDTKPHGGSVVIQAEKPMSGPDRRPSLNVDYRQRVFERNGASAHAYGGLNIQPGQRAQPHLGVQMQREYKNGFIGGFGQVQRGPGGRPSPTFGLNGGFRFKRDVEEVEQEQPY
ncbi:hymenoptaecin [Calliopsis andreniformis]|uniref:hymenoptaecin n=1 Tax=Calliopsis andreniformis TaxID=337506 RepID=UPI003FCDD0A3